MARVSTRQAPVVADLELPATHWRQFRDLRSSQQPASRLDHVVVGPSGVTVITYHRAAAVDELLPHDAARQAADVVRNALPARYREKVIPMLCILDHSPVASSLDGVLVTSLAAVGHIVRSSPLQLSTSEVAAVAEELRHRLEPAPAAPRPDGAGRRLASGVLRAVRRVTVLFLPFRGRRVAE